MKRMTCSTLLRGTALAALSLAGWAQAADLHPPAVVQAGQGFALSLDGSGSATFYLLGPEHVSKRKINLGGEVQIASSDVRTAGSYQIILCQRSCTSAAFEVKAGHSARLSFFLHPSRVPVSARDSIDATAFVFDENYNPVLVPTTVEFHVKSGTGGFSRQAYAHAGVTWVRLDSTPRAGRVQVTAAVGNTQESRVIQQVAAEACRLHVKAVGNGKTVTLETDPVRDCSGNALPDGTIVSFTMTDKAGKSTVDAPIKKGIARTQYTVAGPAHVSVACGVVLGNEVTLGGGL